MPELIANLLFVVIAFIVAFGLFYLFIEWAYKDAQPKPPKKDEWGEYGVDWEYNGDKVMRDLGKFIDKL